MRNHQVEAGRGYIFLIFLFSLSSFVTRSTKSSLVILKLQIIFVLSHSALVSSMKQGSYLNIMFKPTEISPLACMVTGEWN